MFKQLVILFIILGIITGIAYADIINVPDDEDTIQAGINATGRGDTVLVAPGEYEENIVIDNLNIVLASHYLMDEDEDHIAETIIRAANRASVIKIEENSIVLIVGFTIRDGRSISGSGGGGGINCLSSNLSVSHCIVTENSSGNGGGAINGRNSEVNLENCTIANNGCSGIWLNISEGSIINCNIYNNRSRFRGGGIHSRSTNLTIESTVISDNEADARGGGIYYTGSHLYLIINNSEISRNSSEEQSGGIECRWATLLMYRTLVTHNTGLTIGGMSVHGGIDTEIVNCTICNNIAGEDGIGGVDFTVESALTNSILWANEPGQVFDNAEADVNISWSDIQDGWEGDGNFDQDPQFVNPDEGDYHLTEDSPCIDAGNPEGHVDPDGTPSEMGAYHFSQGSLVIEGYVIDAENDDPLSDVEIVTSYGGITLTDSNGYWYFSPARIDPFDINASIIEYNDSTLNAIQVELDDTLSITIGLLHGELEPSQDVLDTEVIIGEREQLDFSIGNPGNGVLAWSVEMRYRGDVGLDSWELRQSYSFGEQLEDSKLYGVAYIDSFFYIAGANNQNPTIYVLNMAGELISSFQQPGDDIRGMKDLAYDGELIWGAIRNTVYGMSLEGDVVTSFDSPHDITSVITWDSDRDILWIGGTTANPVGMDREGNVVEGMEVGRRNMRIYGLAYYPDDPDNSPLYIFHREIDTNRQALTKYNIETNQRTFITYLDPEAGGVSQGAFITNVDPYSTVFISVSSADPDDGGDRVDIWQLESNTDWALLDPIAGTVNPAEEQDITLSINAVDLLEIDYHVEMIFTHSGFGFETIIPFDLTVTSLDVGDSEESLLPLEFEITAVYPNPFNSTVRLNYTLPKTSQVSIKLYDITGSIVDIVSDGEQIAGQHSVTWDASAMPSGIYFARMESDKISQTVKLMLMK